ncbi:MAG TPA: BlaI/MecI/CopY family transcriptional regulator [Candidatus Eremiobacteraeota bacterium]|nr:MAG: Transcriptional regulator BlaI [bacterium ADurb.Bin363]HPZ07226.1 BlaI/MecI/CopY family transcriptional regulator [Candidatus Eremiobacteraeota bacterium]
MKEQDIKLENIHLSGSGIRKALGFLEADIMEIIWEKGKLSVREVFEIIKNKRDIAYTTVMTTMDRLYKKGILSRKKIVKGYTYWPKVTEKRLEKHIIRETLKGLFSDMKEPVMSYFANSEEPEDIEIIKSFATIIDELQKEQDKNDGNN